MDVAEKGTERHGHTYQPLQVHGSPPGGMEEFYFHRFFFISIFYILLHGIDGILGRSNFNLIMVVEKLLSNEKLSLKTKRVVLSRRSLLN